MPERVLLRCWPKGLGKPSTGLGFQGFRALVLGFLVRLHAA